ncbi:MAG: ATP-binding cassette domain-containing protein, partial [Ilumatobacteraceae bacterium]
MTDVLLEVDELVVEIGGRRVVDGVSLQIAEGGRLGIIGESGSGKTLTALSIVGLAPDSATVSGRVRFDGVDLIGRSDQEVSELRG